MTINRYLLQICDIIFKEYKKSAEENMIQIYICEDEKIQLEFWKRTIEDYIKSAKIMAEIVSAR